MELVDDFRYPRQRFRRLLVKLESLDITPWGTTVDFVKIGGIRELIAEGYENHTVMDGNTQ
jgi:hypothetical protein